MIRYSAIFVILTYGKSHRDLGLEYEFLLYDSLFQEATKALVAATTTPGHHHVRDLDEDDDDNHLTNGDTSRDLRMDSDEIVGKQQ